MAGVSFCVAPESSYFFNAKSSSLSVAWSLNCSSEASSSESTVTSFKTPLLEEAAAETGFAQRYSQLTWTTTGFTEKLFAPPHRGNVVPSPKTPLQ